MRRIAAIALLLQATLPFAAAPELLPRARADEPKPTPASAPARKPKLAVLDFRTTGKVESSGAKEAAANVRSEFFSVDKYELIDRELMIERLGEKDFAATTECDEKTCYVRYGKSLSVEKIVGGRLSSFGETWTIEMMLVDVNTGAMEKQFRHQYKGSMDELLDHATAGAREMLGLKAQSDRKRARPVEKELTLDLGGGVKMELVLIPAGEFIMGSPESEEARDNDEGPQHRVRIARPFYMGKYEVTNRQYRRFKSDHDSGSYRGVSFNDDDQPVVNVSWRDAKAFCDWLSRQSGREVRLPSESEWEYACRGGDGRVFPWGNNWPPSGLAGNYTDETAKGKFSDWSFIQGYRDGYAGTAPVGSFAANPFGLYDMGGNVWEWCEDWYHGDYNGAPTDGRAWTSGGDQSRRVLRGGSWGSNVRGGLRSANRSRNSPDYRNDFIGLRVVESGVSASGTP